jgi:uncharacterized membrane protein required for colicin V production
MAFEFRPNPLLFGVLMARVVLAVIMPLAVTYLIVFAALKNILYLLGDPGIFFGIITLFSIAAIILVALMAFVGFGRRLVVEDSSISILQVRRNGQKKCIYNLFLNETNFVLIETQWFGYANVTLVESRPEKIRDVVSDEVEKALTPGGANVVITKASFFRVRIADYLKLRIVYGVKDYTLLSETIAKRRKHVTQS